MPSFKCIKLKKGVYFLLTSAIFIENALFYGSSSINIIELDPNAYFAWNSGPLTFPPIDNGATCEDDYFKV